VIRALVFDFDGVILDTETPFRSSWQEIYAAHGLSVPPDEWAGWLGSSADPPQAYDLLERHLGAAVDREGIRTERMQRELELLEREPPLPGVERILDDASAHGLRLAIASSSERAWVHGHLTRLGLIDRFAVLVCADDVTATKPSPELYVSALRALGVAPREAIAFEDSTHGVRAATAAGIFCVAIPNEVTRHASMEGADLVVGSLADRTLLDYISVAERASRTARRATCSGDPGKDGRRLCSGS